MKTKFKCFDCGHIAEEREFMSLDEPDEYICPKCESDHIGEMGQFKS
jgi:predicted RNA-binding Zn-ribbon protein involved in translation (DUF1610 family)